MFMEAIVFWAMVSGCGDITVTAERGDLFFFRESKLKNDFRATECCLYMLLHAIFDHCRRNFRYQQIFHYLGAAT